MTSQPPVVLDLVVGIAFLFGFKRKISSVSHFAPVKRFLLNPRSDDWHRLVLDGFRVLILRDEAQTGDDNC